MKLFTTRAAILTAEHQLAQSKHESQQNYRRIRSALRSRVRHPSSLLAAAGVGVLIGVWFARRNKPRVKQDGASAWAPIVNVVSTYLNRFGMQRLAEAWARFRTADRHVSVTSADTSSLPEKMK